MWYSYFCDFWVSWFWQKLFWIEKKIQLCLTKIWSNKRSYVLTSLFNYVWPFFTTFLYLHETAALFTKETLKVKRFFLWCDYFTVLYFPKETLQERWGKLFFRKQHFSFLRFITYNHLNWSSFLLYLLVFMQNYRNSQAICYSSRLNLILAAPLKVTPLNIQLTHFWPMFSFYTPWKHQKTLGFLVFSGGIKWEHFAKNYN